MKFTILKKTQLLSLLFLTLLTACGGGGNSTAKNNLRQAEPQPPATQLTLYIHGFDKNGYKQIGVYGDSYDDAAIQKFRELSAYQSSDSNAPINKLEATSYYGDTSPLYYTDQDTQDINNITTQWNGGIPRYAMIVAKYAKHLMQQENVDQINIVSGSMGSLVTRWMIEKDVEGLASNKKISKWYSLEGVIAGNYVAGKKDIIDKFYDDLDSIDILHMSPKWIENNLHSPASEADSPYYKHILLGQEASTDDDLNNGALSNFLFLNGQFSANDGTQRVKDSHFTSITEQARYNNLPPTLTLIHKHHLNIKEHTGAWASVATFLNAKKRITITLLDAQVDNIHEKIRWYNRKAEIIFASKVYSPQTQLIWGTTDAISERTRSGATLPVHKYKKNGEKRILNQLVFDQFVPADETKLHINFTVEEVDYGPKYGVYEARNNHYNLIDDMSLHVPLINGVYPYTSNDWNFRLKIEVNEYPDNF